MPRGAYRTCKCCGRNRDEAGEMSWTRLCMDCAKARLDANNSQIAARSGPFYMHQQRRTLLIARQRLLAAERTGQ